MDIPYIGEILGVLVSFAIIFLVIRWFHKAYQNREKNEKVERKKISDKEWIGETDEDWGESDAIQGNRKISIKIPSRVKKHVLKRDKGKVFPLWKQKTY